MSSAAAEARARRIQQLKAAAEAKKVGAKDDDTQEISAAKDGSSGSGPAAKPRAGKLAKPSEMADDITKGARVSRPPPVRPSSSTHTDDDPVEATGDEDEGARRTSTTTTSDASAKASRTPTPVAVTKKKPVPTEKPAANGKLSGSRAKKKPADETETDDDQRDKDDEDDAEVGLGDSEGEDDTDSPAATKKRRAGTKDAKEAKIVTLYRRLREKEQDGLGAAPFPLAVKPGAVLTFDVPELQKSGEKLTFLWETYIDEDGTPKIPPTVPVTYVSLSDALRVLNEDQASAHRSEVKFAELIESAPEFSPIQFAVIQTGPAKGSAKRDASLAWVKVIPVMSLLRHGRAMSKNASVFDPISVMLMDASTLAANAFWRNADPKSAEEITREADGSARRPEWKARGYAPAKLHHSYYLDAVDPSTLPNINKEDAGAILSSCEELKRIPYPEFESLAIGDGRKPMATVRSLTNSIKTPATVASAAAAADVFPTAAPPSPAAAATVSETKSKKAPPSSSPAQKPSSEAVAAPRAEPTRAAKTEKRTVRMADESDAQGDEPKSSVRKPAPSKLDKAPPLPEPTMGSAKRPSTDATEMETDKALPPKSVAGASSLAAAAKTKGGVVPAESKPSKSESGEFKIAVVPPSPRTTAAVTPSGTKKTATVLSVRGSTPGAEDTASVGSSSARPKASATLSVPSVADVKGMPSPKRKDGPELAGDEKEKAKTTTKATAPATATATATASASSKGARDAAVPPTAAGKASEDKAAIKKPAGATPRPVSNPRPPVSDEVFYDGEDDAHSGVADMDMEKAPSASPAATSALARDMGQAIGPDATADDDERCL